MTEAKEQRVVVFGKLAGFGLLLVGFAALLGAIALVNLASRSSPEPKVGFDVVQLGTFRSDQYLIDRDRGRVWNRVCDGLVVEGNCQGALVWQRQDVEGIY